MGHAHTRRLIWVPVIHTLADLGSLSESLKDAYVRQIGKRQWFEHIRTIEQLWQGIGRQVRGLRLDYERLRLYQDGLPVCGHEERIVRDLAEAGSDNHRLLLELMGRGARIMGTESPELLLEEYQLVRQLLSIAGHDRGRGAKLGDRLLTARDSYIAQRINHTLEPGETALVFLGMLHSIAERMAPDIALAVLGDRGAGRARRVPRRAASRGVS